MYNPSTQRQVQPAHQLLGVNFGPRVPLVLQVRDRGRDACDAGTVAFADGTVENKWP